MGWCSKATLAAAWYATQQHLLLQKGYAWRQGKPRQEKKRPVAARKPDQAVIDNIRSRWSGRMGVNRAVEFGVSQTTLKDRLSGRVLHGTNIRPKKYLLHKEEQELVNFLIKCSKIGYGKTHSEVLRLQ